jgi:hypothetical protein
MCGAERGISALPTSEFFSDAIHDASDPSRSLRRRGLCGRGIIKVTSPGH